MCAQRKLIWAWASAQSDQSLRCPHEERLGPTHWAHYKASDQTGRMPRMIWVFAGHTCYFVGFVMRWLSYYDFMYIFLTGYRELFIFPIELCSNSTLFVVQSSFHGIIGLPMFCYRSKTRLSTTKEILCSLLYLYNYLWINTFTLTEIRKTTTVTSTF